LRSLFVLFPHSPEFPPPSFLPFYSGSSISRQECLSPKKTGGGGGGGGGGWGVGCGGGGWGGGGGCVKMFSQPPPLIPFFFPPKSPQEPNAAFFLFLRREFFCIACFSFFWYRSPPLGPYRSGAFQRGYLIFHPLFHFALPECSSFPIFFF